MLPNIFTEHGVKVNGSRQLVEINYYDPDFPNGFENHMVVLMDAVITVGFAFGAFDNDRLVGFYCRQKKLNNKGRISFIYVLVQLKKQ